MPDNFEYQFARTLAVVKSLADGNKLNLPDGNSIAMDEEMHIGFTMKCSDGEERIAPMATIDLSQLNSILEKHNIGIIIPKRRRR